MSRKPGSGAMIKANFHAEAIAALEAGDAATASAAISRDILAGMNFLLENSKFADEQALTLTAS